MRHPTRQLSVMLPSERTFPEPLSPNESLPLRRPSRGSGLWDTPPFPAHKREGLTLTNKFTATIISLNSIVLIGRKRGAIHCLTMRTINNLLVPLQTSSPSEKTVRQSLNFELRQTHWQNSLSSVPAQTRKRVACGLQTCYNASRTRRAVNMNGGVCVRREREGGFKKVA